jgi:hypothetical protein
MKNEIKKLIGTLLENACENFQTRKILISELEKIALSKLFEASYISGLNSGLGYRRQSINIDSIEGCMAYAYNQGVEDSMKAADSDEYLQKNNPKT